MNLKTWLKGLASAAIGGAVGSVGVVMADPANANPKTIGTVAAMSAASAVVMYLKKSPLP